MAPGATAATATLVETAAGTVDVGPVVTVLAAGTTDDDDPPPPQPAITIAATMIKPPSKTRNVALFYIRKEARIYTNEDRTKMRAR